MATSTEKALEARQDALLKDAMKQPGVAGLMEAYSSIEAAYSRAAAADAVYPVVITTTTSQQ
jgi:hypothetical protein